MGNVKNTKTKGITRRGLMSGAGASVLSFTILKPALVRGTEANTRIEAGCIGLGGRGRMIAGMIQKHGGYQITAIADYFPNVAKVAGKQFKVDESRCFSGLSAYKKLLAGKVDAVFLETPPYCFPDHVEAAVKAGCHVYIAKPLGCDVPGCLRISKMGQKATTEKKVFLADFQTRTDPFYIEGIKRVQAGAIGKIGMLSSEYNDESFSDPPKTATIESRLQRLIWVNDNDLGGSYIVNAGIHAVDVALWIAGERPVSAMGSSRIARNNPHGDSHDVYSVTYEFANGLILNHRGEHLRNRFEFRCECFAQGQNGYLETGYTSRVRILGTKGGYRGGDVENLYPRGAERNIDTFHKSIINGIYDNPTLEPSVNSTLATILGREAAGRNTKLTWDEVIRENKEIKVDITGLKA
ncbi:MAG: Gfo/Idh/MocA family oxidoreductase [Phycisphaerae bacterium]|nr:Gfo/Idh/MocA family oxidoreductase [Phycisphaerae bacterium]NIP51340.1 Gfo/Idh/MocA family oxidoreductase [Phycisphaerae bacterium]NIS50534.1 Gfo/Idh/MocA family oxidoreductase [Phycisphaerae bacterium]NIU08269.1 Gfo/Idh/MocA family oxidoreductase [Phycisphaerae bacterium]NIU55765.1 Gfo/Idh/MocA family oxidoreductase [Phycisphaerae bacterium]